jgi:hypothetical protein
MRRFFTSGCVFALLMVLGSARASAETTAELVETKMIWNHGKHNALTDLVRFKDRWYCVCREGNDAHSPDGLVRIITSPDGATWESAALIPSPAPDKGLIDPKLTVTPARQLLLTAAGGLPQTSLQSMAWFSSDGRNWSQAADIGDANFWFGRICWHRGIAHCFGLGYICGNSQTVQISALDSDRRFKRLFNETFSRVFPMEAALVFDGDRGYCLMGRTGPNKAHRIGYLATATAPYREWTWKEMAVEISDPNLLRLPDGRLFATVGLTEPKPRTALCEFGPPGGKLMELLELPTRGEMIDVGLAWHDEHLWVSYHAPHEGKSSVFLAKIRIKKK